jgi:hypothetical protein
VVRGDDLAMRVADAGEHPFEFGLHSQRREPGIAEERKVALAGISLVRLLNLSGCSTSNQAKPQR